VNPPTPGRAAAAQCARLAAGLPATIEGLSTRATRPASPLTHAWGNPAVVLRCGVGRPPGIAGSQILRVNGVRWFRQPAAGSVTWTALRPHADVALTLATSYDNQAAFLVDLAAPLKRAVP
jgi:hypothetical protein